MQECWKFEPKDRPSFKELLAKLDSFKEEMEKSESSKAKRKSTKKKKKKPVASSSSSSSGSSSGEEETKQVKPKKATLRADQSLSTMYHQVDQGKEPVYHEQKKTKPQPPPKGASHYEYNN